MFLKEAFQILLFSRRCRRIRRKIVKFVCYFTGIWYIVHFHSFPYQHLLVASNLNRFMIFESNIWFFSFSLFYARRGKCIFYNYAYPMARATELCGTRQDAPYPRHTLSHFRYWNGTRSSIISNISIYIYLSLLMSSILIYGRWYIYI